MLDSEMEYSGMFPWIVGPPVLEKGYCLPIRQERILIIPISHLMGIISGRAKYWIPTEIPLDSLPVRVFQDSGKDCICIVLSHPSFPPVVLGCAIPSSTLIVTYPDPIPVLPTPEDPIQQTDESLYNREV